MTFEKTKVGLLIGFISVILALFILVLFVPISTIFLALVLMESDGFRVPKSFAWFIRFYLIILRFS